MNNTNTDFLLNKMIGQAVNLNDNKNLSTLFEGPYELFLDNHKGTQIENKEDIIRILNRKPRSFLSTLTILVNAFKLYDNQIKTFLNNKHPLNQITLMKDNYRKDTKNSNYNLPKFEILTEKINTLKNALKNNNLSIPLNLLNPLLKKNSKSNVFTSNISSQISLNNSPSEVMAKFDYSSILGLGQDLKNNLNENNILNINYSKYTKLLNLIKNYNLNNIVPITKMKYLKMISNSKLENTFQQNISFNFNLHNNKPILHLSTILEYAFRGMSCLISKPILMETPDKLKINLLYFLVPGKVKKIKKVSSSIKGIATSFNGIELPESLNKSVSSGSTLKGLGGSKGKWNTFNKAKNTIKKLLTEKNISKLNLLTTILSRLFKKPIELDLIRLHLPFFDENILVKAIGIMSKKVHVRNIIKYIFRKTIIHSKSLTSSKLNSSTIPSFLAGIRIRIGGRLMTQRVIPRMSTRVIQRGAIARGKVNSVDWSRINMKNKRGAYSITVTMSHV